MVRPDREMLSGLVKTGVSLIGRVHPRTSTSRGLLFYRILQLGTNTDPVPLTDLVIPHDADASPAPK